jgi:hypothetical protein
VFNEIELVKMVFEVIARVEGVDGQKEEGLEVVRGQKEKVKEVIERLKGRSGEEREFKRLWADAWLYPMVIEGLAISLK